MKSQYQSPCYRFRGIDVRTDSAAFSRMKNGTENSHFVPLETLGANTKTTPRVLDDDHLGDETGAKREFEESPGSSDIETTETKRRHATRGNGTAS